MNVTKNIQVVAEVERGDTFWHRAIGLMGKSDLKSDRALWLMPGLLPSNSIHTCFMRFAIDAVFVNRDLKVVKIYENLKPWKFTAPVLGAASVFEMKAGTLKNARIEVGDSLNVVN